MKLSRDIIFGCLALLLLVSCGKDEKDGPQPQLSPLLGMFGKLDCNFNFDTGLSGDVDLRRENQGQIGLAGSFEGTAQLTYQSGGYPVQASYKFSVTFKSGSTLGQSGGDANQTQLTVQGEATAYIDAYEGSRNLGRFSYQGTYRGVNDQVDLDLQVQGYQTGDLEMNCRIADAVSTYNS